MTKAGLASLGTASFTYPDIAGLVYKIVRLVMYVFGTLLSVLLVFSCDIERRPFISLKRNSIGTYLYTNYDFFKLAMSLSPGVES